MPLHLDALARGPELKNFLEEIVRPLDATFLSPKGWFGEGHGTGAYVWTPAPAAADVVVDQLGHGTPRVCIWWCCLG
jgi:hypothetical protein